MDKYSRRVGWYCGDRRKYRQSLDLHDAESLRLLDTGHCHPWFTVGSFLSQVLDAEMKLNIIV